MKIIGMVLLSPTFFDRDGPVQDRQQRPDRPPLPETHRQTDGPEAQRKPGWEDVP